MSTRQTKSILALGIAALIVATFCVCNSALAGSIVSWGSNNSFGWLDAAMLSVGTHTTTLTVTGNNGLKDTDTVTIAIASEPEPPTCSPVGTWQINSSIGTTTRYFDCFGTVTGPSEIDIDLQPDGPHCILTYNISATYSWDPETCCLSYHWEGWKTCGNFDIKYIEDVSGCTTGCDTGSGSTSIEVEVYLQGTKVGGDSGSEPWTANRTSKPSNAINLSPSNEATNQSIDVDLTWSNCGACTFDVYFGTSNPPTMIICPDTDKLICDPGTLSYEITYYWRVNSKNTNGTTTGNVQQFTTEVSTNLPPVIESVSASPDYILDNQTSSLEVVASDSDGPSRLSYNWTIQPPGQGSLDDYNSPSPIYTPPDIAGSQQIFTITVEVSDGQDVNSASVNITVIDINSITCDFYQDGFIDFYDYAILAAYFADTNCSEPNWCEGTDVDHSGSIDIVEFSIFAERWLTEVIDLDLLAYWTMDDDAPDTIVVDSSLYGNDGAAQQNTEDLNVPGIIDGALTFNGSSDYIDCGNDNSFDLTDAITISAWINPSSFPTNYNDIVSKRNSYYFIADGSGHLMVYLRDSIADYFTGNAVVSGWTHVSMTYDRSKISLYVNGSLDAWTDASSPIHSSTYNVLIAGVQKFDRTGADSGRHFNGFIDEVMIFNRALSSGEISTLAGVIL